MAMGPTFGATDDLAAVFAESQRVLRVVPRPAGLVAQGIAADAFAEAAHQGSGFDPEVGRLLVMASSVDKRDADYPEDDDGGASWYELDDRLHYLRLRAPNGVLVTDFTWREWRRTLGAFDWSCAYCGSRGEVGQDHVVPIAKGGQDLMANILPACLPCNRTKGQASLPAFLLGRGTRFLMGAQVRIVRGLERLQG
jgi:hypothetical protein